MNARASETNRTLPGKRFYLSERDQKNGAISTGRMYDGGAATPPRQEWLTQLIQEQLEGGFANVATLRAGNNARTA